MPSRLILPRSSFAAAHEFGESQLGISGSSESDLEERIMQLHGKVSYGVSQAVSSGLRLRLFDQFDPSQIQLNCGEAGIAAFTLHKEFSGREDLQILRYRPTLDSSYHFGLVHPCDDGELTIIDPLMNLHGKIRLTKDGFAFYPFEWLESHGIVNAATLPGLTLDSRDRTVPLSVQSDLVFLDENTLVRHINYINSPLGFFAYFADGQRLEDKPVAEGNILFSAELGEEGLMLRGTAVRKIPMLAYTVERHYDWDGTLKDEAELLHAKMHWVRPEMVLYSCSAGKEEIPEEIDVTEQSSVLHFLTTASESKKFMFSPQQRGALLRRMRQTLGRWQQQPPDGNGIYTLLGMGIINIPIGPGEELVKILEDQCGFLSDGSPTTQEGLDSRLNRVHFVRRAQGLPNQWPEKKVLDSLRVRVDRAKQAFDADIRNYFGSSPVTALLSQYREAIKAVEENRHVFS